MRLRLVMAMLVGLLLASGTMAVRPTKTYAFSYRAWEYPMIQLSGYYGKGQAWMDQACRANFQAQRNQGITGRWSLVQGIFGQPTYVRLNEVWHVWGDTRNGICIWNR